MLQLRDIAFKIADRILFQNVNWTINTNKRIALIGPNGAGKTTLLKIIHRDLPAETGEIIKPKMYEIGYLPQEEIALRGESVLSEVLRGNHQLTALNAKMQQIQTHLRDQNPEGTDQGQTIAEYGSLEQRFAQLGGYGLEAQAKKILAGLGFKEDEYKRPLSELSGGWIMRVHLARLLLQNPDLLLLDEPTNHLDLESLEWLENYLLNFEGSVILVSHDRFFISRLSQEISELDRGRLTSYKTDYDGFKRQKLIDHERIVQEATSQQEEKERILKFINRFRYKASKAPQVQSRIKRLEKLSEIEIPPEQKSITFKIECAVKSYHDVCVINHLSFGYGQEKVFDDLDLTIYRGEKAALVGVNGAGKTTLTRLIAGEIEPDNGKINLGQRVKISYYAQHRSESLELKNTVFEELLESAAPLYRTKIRDILGVFKFSGRDVEKDIAVLSGGEKARVSLAKILTSPANFIIMDEPTNHLDLSSKQALEVALSSYDGTLLLISHDRYFLDRIATAVIELKSGRLKKFEGNYSDYIYKSRQSDDAISEKNNRISGDGTKSKDRKESRRIGAQARQKISASRNQLQDKIKQLEKDIEHLEKEKLEIERLLGNPSLYKDGLQAAEASKRYQEIQSTLPGLYTQWETTQLHLEQIISSLSIEQ